MCNCTGTTKIAICSSIEQGANSIEAIRTQICAYTVCGSCETFVQSDWKRDLWFNTDTKLWSGYSLLVFVGDVS